MSTTAVGLDVLQLTSGAVGCLGVAQDALLVGDHQSASGDAEDLDSCVDDLLDGVAKRHSRR
jgi:hypothetical protein